MKWMEFIDVAGFEVNVDKCLKGGGFRDVGADGLVFLGFLGKCNVECCWGMVAELVIVVF